MQCLGGEAKGQRDRQGDDGGYGGEGCVEGGGAIVLLLFTNLLIVPAASEEAGKGSM